MELRLRMATKLLPKYLGMKAWAPVTPSEAQSPVASVLIKQNNSERQRKEVYSAWLH